MQSLRTEAFILSGVLFSVKRRKRTGLHWMSTAVYDVERLAC